MLKKNTKKVWEPVPQNGSPKQVINKKKKL